jgi:hypothetical protein
MGFERGRPSALNKTIGMAIQAEQQERKGMGKGSPKSARIDASSSSL